MANAKNVLGLLAGITLCAAAAANAQSPQPATEKFFVNVNFGEQLATRTVGASATKTVYEETATLSSTQPVNRGPVFDVGGGYRVWRDIFVGIIISRYSDTETASTTASVPDPIFFNRAKTVTGTTADLKRSELGVYPHAVWTMPLISDKLDLAVSGGFAIIKVKQDLVVDFAVPQGTQTVITSTTTHEATANGLYAAIDVIYNIMARIGVGGYVRYAGAKVDLGPVVDANVGGMHVGGGVRLRF